VKQRPGSGFNISVSVDGLKTVPCPGACNCGDVVNELCCGALLMCTKCMSIEFLLDMEINGQPMKLLRRRCYVVEQSRANDKSCGGIEDSLKWLSSGSRNTCQNRVAVVKL